MASAIIQVTLPLDGDGIPYYSPGGTITGRVQVTPSDEVRCNHLWVRLQWHTEGRGDRDEGRAAEMDVFQGTLAAGVTVGYDFHFVLPMEPWSYAGHYVSIIWEIAVDVDVPWSVNPRHSQPFVMAPERPTARPASSRFDVELTAMGSVLRWPELMRALKTLAPHLTPDEVRSGAGVLVLQSVDEDEAQRARELLEAAGVTAKVIPRA